jgi:hypothetical protein
VASAGGDGVDLTAAEACQLLKARQGRRGSSSGVDAVAADSPIIPNFQPFLFKITKSLVTFLDGEPP